MTPILLSSLSFRFQVDVIFPYLSFAKAFLLRMKWESIIKVASITRPILFLSGARVCSQHSQLHMLAFCAPLQSDEHFRINQLYHIASQRPALAFLAGGRYAESPMSADEFSITCVLTSSRAHNPLSFPPATLLFGCASQFSALCFARFRTKSFPPST